MVLPSSRRRAMGVSAVRARFSPRATGFPSLVLTPMYNCARIKLTAPRDGCKLWSMRLIIHPGGSHDQEQDSEYDTRIVSTREVHSRHCDHVRAGQEYRA